MPVEWVRKDELPPPHFFSVATLKRFQAAWMGLNYKVWVESDNRDSEGNIATRNHLRAGLRAIFPDAAFEPED